MQGELVRIVPPQPDGDRIAVSSQGTEIFCGDHKIRGVTSITVHFDVNEAVKADITLCSVLQELCGVIPKYFITHPLTGKNVEVESITLANGEKFNFLCNAENPEPLPDAYNNTRLCN